MALLLLLVGCDFTIAHRQPDGSATTWECHTIEYRINPAGLRPSQIDAFRDAFRAAHSQSGVPVRYLGTTGRHPAVPMVGPVIVYLTDLPGATAARTELHYDGDRYDGGYIMVDPGLSDAYTRTVAWHEVGHVFGLGHSSSSQVMGIYGIAPPYRDGDRAGLRAVGC